MPPLDSTAAAELQEPGLLLTEDTPPAASGEPAAAEAVETPGPGCCWLCRSSPWGSRAQPGECGCGPRRQSRPGGTRRALAREPSPRGASRTATPPLPSALPRAPGDPRAVTWGQQSGDPRTRRRERKFRIVLGTFWNSKAVKLFL